MLGIRQTPSLFLVYLIREPNLSRGMDLFGGITMDTAALRWNFSAFVRPASRRAESGRGRSLFLAAGALLGLLGCATTPPPTLTALPPAPPALQENRPEGGLYETPPPALPVEILPAGLSQGDDFRVASPVRHTGFNRLYLIETEYGAFPALGEEMLQKRIREVHAIRWMRQMTSGQSYRKGLGKSMKDVALSPFRTLKKMVRNPLYAVAAIPTDVFKVYGLVDETRKLMSAGFSREAVNEYIGFNQAVHDLARLLGVDRTSTNLVLREHLYASARSFYAGGAPLRIAGDFIPGVPIPKIEVGSGRGSVGKGLDKVLNEIDPRTTSKQLRTMKTPRPTRKALEANPFFPSHTRRAFVNALWSVKKAEGRAAVVQAAAWVDNEDRAFRFQRGAEILAAYHRSRVPIQAVHPLPHSDVLAGITEDRDLVIPIHGDYLAWNEETACLFEHWPEYLPAGIPYEPGEVLVAGIASSRARMELEVRGFHVEENAAFSLGAELVLPRAPALEHRPPSKESHGPEQIQTNSHKHR